MSGGLGKPPQGYSFPPTHRVAEREWDEGAAPGELEPETVQAACDLASGGLILDLDSVTKEAGQERK